MSCATVWVAGLPLGDGPPEGAGVADGAGVGLAPGLAGAAKSWSSAFWNDSAMTTRSWVARITRCSSGIFPWLAWTYSGST